LELVVGGDWGVVLVGGGEAEPVAEPAQLGGVPAGVEAVVAPLHDVGVGMVGFSCARADVPYQAEAQGEGDAEDEVWVEVHVEGGENGLDGGGDTEFEIVPLFDIGDFESGDGGEEEAWAWG
jgi:hypothetical protein